MCFSRLGWTPHCFCAGDTSGFCDFAPAFKYLLTLRAGSMDAAVAPTSCCWRCHPRTLRRRQCGGLPIRRRCKTISGSTAGTSCQIQTGTAPGQNAADSLRAIRRATTSRAWGRKAGDIRPSVAHFSAPKEQFAIARFHEPDVGGSLRAGHGFLREVDAHELRRAKDRRQCSIADLADIAEVRVNGGAQERFAAIE